MSRILILMSDTGGGHRASAQALEAAFAERFGERFEITIIDLWSDYTPWPINRLPGAYSPIVNNAIWFWKFAWRASEQNWLTKGFLRFMGWITRGAMRQAFLEHDPDLVISVHPLMQDIPLRLLRRKLRSDIPFVTVVTDLVSINPTWFHNRVDRCFVASEEAYRRALRKGLTPEQVKISGLPVRPVFAHPTPSTEELRRKLGIAVDRDTVLVVSGGEGMGPVGPIARSLAKRLAAEGRNAQLVVVCGRNQRLREELSAQSWPIPVSIQGFVSNMPDWMAASNVIVTKAGPGTIAEALISGLPIMLSGFIAGQEAGNVPYVVDHGVGAYSTDPEKIAETVSRWFGPEREELRAMAQRARQMGKPQSTFDIVEEIATLL